MKRANPIFDYVAIAVILYFLFSFAFFSLAPTDWGIIGRSLFAVIFAALSILNYRNA